VKLMVPTLEKVIETGTRLPIVEFNKVTPALAFELSPANMTGLFFETTFDPEIVAIFPLIEILFTISASSLLFTKVPTNTPEPSGWATIKRLRTFIEPKSASTPSVTCLMLRVDALKPAPQPVRNSADIAAIASVVSGEDFFMRESYAKVFIALRKKSLKISDLGWL